MGTTFCRLCGRTYVEAPEVEPLVMAAAPVAVVETVMAPQAPPAPPVAPPPPPAPVAAPPVAAPPPPPPAPPAMPVVPVQAPPAVPELIAVQAPVAIQVHLPLIEATPEPKPSVTATAPLDLGGPTVEAPELVETEDEPTEDKPKKVRRELDRAALLAGALGGFLGGAVSGAAVTLFLS